MINFAKTSGELIAELARLIEDEDEADEITGVFLKRLDEIVIDWNDRKILQKLFSQGEKLMRQKAKVKRKSKKHLTTFNTDEFGSKKGSKSAYVNTLLQQGKLTIEDIAINAGVSTGTVQRFINKLIKNPKVVIIFSADGTVYGRARNES